MKASQERTTKKALKAAIVSLQAVDTLLNGVFARDSESAINDGFPEQSTGGGSGKGSHSDRTSDHATRESQADPVHADVEQIAETIAHIRSETLRIERVARRLTAHERSIII